MSTKLLSQFQDIGIRSDANNAEEIIHVVPPTQRHKLDFESMIEKLRNVTGKGTPRDMVAAYVDQLLAKESLILLINRRERNIQKQRMEYAEKQEQLSKSKANKELVSDK